MGPCASGTPRPALVRTFEGEKGHGKTSFDLDPRGGRIVVIGPAGTVECYELATGRLAAAVGTAPRPGADTRLSPDGKRLAVGHETPPHTLLDADTLEVRSTIGTRPSHQRRTIVPEQEDLGGNIVFNHAGDRIGHNITTLPNQMRIAESATDRTASRFHTSCLISTRSSPPTTVSLSSAEKTGCD